MAAVNLGPFQTIKEVGWNGPFVLFSMAWDGFTDTNMFLELIHPAGTGYNDEETFPADETDYNRLYIKLVAAGNSVDIFWIVWYWNISKMASAFATNLALANFPAMQFNIGFSSALSGNDTAGPYSGKVRSVVYTGASRPLLPSFSPNADDAATVDEALEALLLPGGTVAGHVVTGIPQPWDTEFDITVPQLSPDELSIPYKWLWDYRNRNNALLYPPSGDAPEFSPT